MGNLVDQITSGELTMIWRSVGDTNVCPDCERRHGGELTFEEWVAEGLPGAGATRCGGNCRCVLVPAAFIGVRKAAMSVVRVTQLFAGLDKTPAAAKKEAAVAAAAAAFGALRGRLEYVGPIRELRGRTGRITSGGPVNGYVFELDPDQRLGIPELDRVRIFDVSHLKPAEAAA